MIKVNQNAWLKPHIDMNADLRKKQKMNLNFLKLMNNAIHRKLMKNVRQYRYIKLLTAKFKLFGVRTKLSY